MTNENRDAYNMYTDFPRFAYIATQHLINNNELVWKLISDVSPDAYKTSKPNLTPKQKAALIWNGVGIPSDFRVFLDDGEPSPQMNEVCMIRIMPFEIIPKNRTVGIVPMLFEVYSHYSINTLTNYQTRVDTIIQSIIGTFNGVSLSTGIGRLHLNQAGTKKSKVVSGGQIPFKGKWIIMGQKVG